MRRLYSAHRRKSGILIGLLVVLSFVGGCAEKGGKRISTGKRIPHKDVIRPAEMETSPEKEAMTPQRVASQQLVAKGLSFMDEKNYELAAVRFQDAINVDPRNGEAYYYMALADYYMGQYDTAVGLLDKAQALLEYDPKWVDRIENLRASILAGEVEETTTQPI